MDKHTQTPACTCRQVVVSIHAEVSQTQCVTHDEKASLSVDVEQGKLQSSLNNFFNIKQSAGSERINMAREQTKSK
jgi:hypothetical protein